VRVDPPKSGTHAFRSRYVPVLTAETSMGRAWQTARLVPPESGRALAPVGHVKEK
jgi:hypothetical protein